MTPRRVKRETIATLWLIVMMCLLLSFIESGWFLIPAVIGFTYLVSVD